VELDTAEGSSYEPKSERIGQFPTAGPHDADGPHTLPGTKPYFMDSPGWQGISGIPNIPNMTSYGMWHKADFHLFVLYLPPGEAAFVPLRVRDWHGEGQFMYTVASGWGTPSDSSDLGTVTPYPDHPIWSQYYP
jgi:hypothetical protein